MTFGQHASLQALCEKKQWESNKLKLRLVTEPETLFRPEIGSVRSSKEVDSSNPYGRFTDGRKFT
ncbi:unnamed protein product [Brassica rapa]|uniref:Uncharacterized protein n=1 Tax=Brassica campestris TaxID=3711 RepID=A0A8D9H720_BRACM|nr:unnamed protein product [Brassica rapa]